MQHSCEHRHSCKACFHFVNILFLYSFIVVIFSVVISLCADWQYPRPRLVTHLRGMLQIEIWIIPLTLLDARSPDSYCNGSK
jgi:hypothetical protein